MEKHTGSKLGKEYIKAIYCHSVPFRYDLSQIPYDYTVEVTNRFKGLDLILAAGQAGACGEGL